MFATKETQQTTDLASRTNLTGHTEARKEPPVPSPVLQRYLGNSFLRSDAGRAVSQAGATSRIPMIQRACTCGGSCASCAGEEMEGRKLQAKMTIGATDDVYEQEAEQVADQVMRMAAPPTEVGLRRSASGVDIRRRVPDDHSVSASEADIQISQEGGQSLSSETKTFMQPRFGIDFGHVRLHSDEHAHQTAAQIQARAFTYGSHIWLGKGESEQDKHLMAHELTHVVQQGAAMAAEDKQGPLDASRGDVRVQRDVNTQCPNGLKTVTMDLVSLSGSTRNPVDDLNFANTIYRPCCVQFQLGTGLSVGATNSDAWLGGDTIMSRATTAGAIHAEQSTTYDQATATYHLAGRIRAFYVEDMNPSIARATSFPAVWATGAAAPYVGMVIVTNTGAGRSLAHEIGHILLNVSGGVHTAHPGGTDNLMEPTDTATGETLEPAQCATIFANA
jgi:Domain of unknown function (DUF4157)